MIKKIAVIVQSIAFILTVIWFTILFIGVALDYKVSSDNLIDDLAIITSDTTINKWIDVDQVYSFRVKDKKVDLHVGVTFIPSENSIYMKMLKKARDGN